VCLVSVVAVVCGLERVVVVYEMRFGHGGRDKSTSLVPGSDISDRVDWEARCMDWGQVCTRHWLI